MAIALLIGGLVFWIWPPAEQGLMVQLEATCWRIGGCLAVLWLAYPDLRNIPRWFWICHARADFDSCQMAAIVSAGYTGVDSLLR